MRPKENQFRREPTKPADVDGDAQQHLDDSNIASNKGVVVAHSSKYCTTQYHRWRRKILAEWTSTISTTVSVFLDNVPAATADASSEIQEEADQLILERSNISEDFVVLIEPGWMEKESWSWVDFIVKEIRKFDPRETKIQFQLVIAPFGFETFKLEFYFQHDSIENRI